MCVPKTKNLNPHSNHKEVCILTAKVIWSTFVDMAYKQIGSEDYGCIAKMLKVNFSYSEIARTINKNVGSVSRHVRNNGGRDN